jgi:myo-inositol-1(or 4)-monophosphatase
MMGAAHKAARALVRDFGEVEQLQVSRKGPGDFVSAADMRAERTLRRELSKARPDFGFLLEEGGEVAGGGRSRWIIDPLDGTTNFLHGIPHFAISIGLETDGELVAGVVYEPVHDELYWAEKGAGAHVTGGVVKERRLRVSGRNRLEECLFATGIPFKGRDDHALFQDQLGRVMAVSSGVRRFGSAALDLAYVAAGRYDGFWETGLKPWDMAAGIVIVREAGGYVGTLDGRDPMAGGTLVAANPQAYAALAELLKGAAD